jgi:hypothetical protein
LTACVDPISPTTRKAARSRPAAESARSRAAREPEPRSRTIMGSARNSSGPPVGRPARG